MKQLLLTIRDFFLTHQKTILIILGSVVGAGALVALITFLVIDSMPKIVYQPVKACDLLTLDEAKSLLGPKGFNGNDQAPVITKDNAVSTCSYSDVNDDQTQVRVIAVSVRSAINDKGMLQNQVDFAYNKPTTGTEPVKDIGDGAYFNKGLGQLNILDDKKIIILSYGVGLSPETNTLEDAVTLAKLVLN